ncbi:hypothetical protein AYO21_06428 [Fonsecaea monophora]|uniref:Uncharacterized protein n=1 Tax=Fonsecaea monophora TaxID=254056 RepID=A0A177F7L1_9EURO|nr:hypothetical protein AYO21_06428 [Fonsecaea monophora]OAG39412.1 hypothetical protein AYO21_06428 [Fonsecaea monophora]
MAFLKRKRQDNEARFPKSEEQKSRNKRVTSPHYEIADFFTRSTGLRRERRYSGTPPSVEFHISQTASPSQDRVSLMRQRLSPVVQSNTPESKRFRKAHSPIASVPIRPTSSDSEGFLEKFTTDALLHGVDEFSHGPRRHYSLNDLKRLAIQVATDLTGIEGACHHDIDITGDVQASTSQSHMSILATSMEKRDSPRPTMPWHPQNLYHTAEGCSGVRSEHPSGPDLNHNRVLPYSNKGGEGEQDIDRSPSRESATIKQLVSPDYHCQGFGNDFVGRPGPSCHVDDSEVRLGDGQVSLHADAHPELRLLPAMPAVAGNCIGESKALHTTNADTYELDEFDTELLRLGTELALAQSGTMADRQSPWYEAGVETSIDIGRMTRSKAGKYATYEWTIPCFMIARNYLHGIVMCLRITQRVSRDFLGDMFYIDLE